MAEERLLLPDGTRLLHVGPYKTGTTALQAAMWTAREDMLGQGVRMAGRSRNPAAAVRAITGRPSPYSDEGKTPPIARWDELARDLRKARESRVIVSSEFFAWATPEVIRTIVADVGGEGIHVAVTLRPLARIIPSMWQQNVQTGAIADFDKWVRGVLREPPEKANQSFWTLHRHNELIARWADVVGPDRVVAVVVDERDHLVLMRVFEGLLGLRDGTLLPERDWSNRSLTLPEAEAIRAFNIAFNKEGLPKALHARLMRFGAAQLMKRRDPAPTEPKVELPAWAVEPVGRIQRDIVDGIAASGVRIVGDLGRLTAKPDAGKGAAGPVTDAAVSPDIAAAMAMGLLVATGEARRSRLPGRRFQLAEPVEVTRVPTYQVAGVLVMRGLRFASRPLDAIRRRTS